MEDDSSTLDGRLFNAVVPSATAAKNRRWAAQWRRGGLCLLAICFAAFLPGLFSIPPIDRDESRFAQASRQMLESGSLDGWVVPRVQDRPRLNKPPLIYWTQAASAAVLGDSPGQWAALDGGNENIWVYRVPSVLSAIAAVILTWRLGVSMFDPRPAWLAGVMLAVSPVVLWEAHQARADQLLLALTTATMLACWNCVRWLMRTPDAIAPLRLALPMWIGLSLGILTKGPITPMVLGLAVIAFAAAGRSWSLLRRLRPVLGLAVMLALVTPWVFLVARQIGWSEYVATVWTETVGRSTEAREGHSGPPGYHTVLLVVLFWPGSLMTAGAIVSAFKHARRRFAATSPVRIRNSRRRIASPTVFLLAWILPAWIVFEVVSTKLPHYTMPLYPAIALLSARAVWSAVSPAGATRRWGASLGERCWLLIGALLVAVFFGTTLLMVLWLFTPEDVAAEPLPLSPFAIGGLVALLAASAFCYFRAARALSTDRPASVLWAGALIILLAGAANTLGVPHIASLSTRVCAAVRRIDPAFRRPLGAAGYAEDSLVFLTRGRLRRLNEEERRQFLSQHHDGVLLLNDDSELLQPIALGVVKGWNYTKGREETISIVQNKDGAPPQ